MTANADPWLLNGWYLERRHTLRTHLVVEASVSRQSAPRRCPRMVTHLRIAGLVELLPGVADKAHAQHALLVGLHPATLPSLLVAPVGLKPLAVTLLDDVFDAFPVSMVNGLVFVGKVGWAKHDEDLVVSEHFHRSLVPVSLPVRVEYQAHPGVPIEPFA